MRPLLIIGAGGQGRVVSEIAKLCGYQKIGFLDDADGHNTVGRVLDFVQHIETCDFFVAIGNNTVRKRIFCDLENYGAKIISLIHPNAVISETAEIGKGTAVMAGAVINANAKIGKGVIVNTCSSVDHDCVIGSFCHIAVGARVCGTVTVDDGTWIGAGATIINNISICKDCTVGAGAVVVKDLNRPGTYVGVPAKANSKRTNNKSAIEV